MGYGDSVTHAIGKPAVRYRVKQRFAETLQGAGRIEKIGFSGHRALLLSRSPLDELIDLVITGPAPRAVGRDTAVVVSELFRRASKSVTVVGYAVSRGREVFRTLAEQMNKKPDLHVRLYLEIQRPAGDTSANSEIVQRFMHRFATTQWPEEAGLPEVYYDPRALAVDRAGRAALHAKCVVVDDQEVFVSSANFTEFAQERNIEIGLSLCSRQVACRISAYLAELSERGQLRPALYRESPGT